MVARDNVVKSNIWGNSKVGVGEAMTLYENLRISLLFFNYNVELKFHTTVMDKLEKYTQVDRGDGVKAFKMCSL